jgi:hypothetical protein
VALDRTAEEARPHARVGLDGVDDCAAVRKAKGERPLGLVPLGGDPDERSEHLAVQQPAVLADQVEPPVLAHAEALEQHLLALREGESLDGCDRDPGDTGHDSSLAPADRLGKSKRPGQGGRP